MATQSRLRRLADKAVPSRESIESSRLLKPVTARVMHSSLWRFTRRSVPRGVALGMLTGVLVPMGQIPASALLALPLRANIPAAAATTFFTNPVTTPPLWVAAYWLGSWMLGPRAAHEVLNGDAPGWLDWLLHQAGPATLTGLVTIAIALAVLGYFGSGLLWRWWILRKRRRRLLLRHAAHRG